VMYDKAIIDTDNLRLIEDRLEKDVDSVSIQDISTLAKHKRIYVGTKIINTVNFQTNYKVDTFTDLVKKLSPKTAQFMLLCQYYVNHNGVLSTLGGVRFTSFKEFVKYLGVMSYRTFARRVYKQLTDNKIVFEKALNNKEYLVVNPFIISSGDEITELKFYLFYDLFERHLPELQFLYLKKLYSSKYK
jgi:hypothetical protein